MPDPIVTPLVTVTTNALGSVNPMGTPIMPPQSMGGEVRGVEPVQFVVEEVVEEQSFDDSIEEIQIEEEPKVEEPPPKLIIKTPTKIKKGSKTPIIESRSPEGLPSYRCEFEGRDIMVGFPCYKTTNPVTAFALLSMALDYGRDKIRFDMSIGDAMIYHARNVLAQKFLDTDARWLLMVDDDIIPCIGRPSWMKNWVAAARNLQDNVLQRNVLARLIGSNKTLVGGAYFGRQEGGAIMCSDLKLAPRAKVYEDAVIPVEWVATGCMLVHRKVFEDIREKHPELETPNNSSYKFDYFLPTKDSGEDVAFCRRALASGHQPHVDIGLPVFHVGYKTY